MKGKYLIFICVLLNILSCKAFAEYALTRSLPLDYESAKLRENRYINHNYGEYRGGNSYTYHDGMDYFVPLENRVAHMPIYPVSSGTAHVYPDLTKNVSRSKIPATELDAVTHLFIDPSQQTLIFKPNTTVASIESCSVTDGTKLVLKQGLVGSKKGWGHCVIVDHVTFQTRYAHLSGIDVTDGQWVDTSTVLGLSGNTGASDGEHLHFSIGSNVEPANTINPILAGLKQPKYGEIRKVACPKGFEIRLLATGTDGTFGGTNDVILSDANETINIPKPGQPLKAVISAYHYTGRAYTTPYKIEFEVEKIKGTNDFVKQKKEIVFDSIANINKMSEPPYCFSRPYVTKAKKTEDYYSIKFTPTAGKYKITAKIYSCYRDDSGFRLSEPEVAEREITVGLNGLYAGDLDWYDPNVSYAWLPDDIVGGGTMVAAAGAGGIRATAVAEGPEIFYAFANNNIVTNNILDVDENLQRNAVIESRTKNKSNWTIRFFNSSGIRVDEKTVNNQDWLRYEWSPSVSAGDYSFNVTAQDLTTGGVSTYESFDSITIDNTKPLAYISMVNNSVSTSEQIITANVKPSEDLYSMIVNVVNNRDYSLVQERVYSSPSGKKDQEETVEWEDAYSYPDGYYNFEIIMTDLAGNIAKYYSPILSVNKGGGYPPAPTNEAYNPVLPTPPPWPERPKISDIAFDNSGNEYVLYGQLAKIVKYGPDGKEIKNAKSFGGVDMICPLGLAISPYGDRVYIADSYNIRVLIYDTDLNLIKEIKGKDAYIAYGDVDTYSWQLFWRGIDFSGSAGGGIKKQNNEQYYLPEDVAIINNGSYVVDKDKHRVLKYDANGEGTVFSILKADLREEARNAFNQNNTIGGQTVDRALFYSNSLNDKIVFDRNSVGPYPDGNGKTWVKEMFLHMNLPGNVDGQFTAPESIALDSTSSLYVCDSGNNRIQKFSPDGSFVSKFGSEGDGPGQFKSPQGIAIDEDNHIWVADTGNKRIQEFTGDGTFIKSWGNAEMLSKPLKLVVKKIGRNKAVYVADGDKNEVQIFGVSPPTDFHLTETGNKLFSGNTFVINWTTSEADWYGLKRYDVYTRIVKEGMDESDENSWVYLKKNIPTTENSTEVTLPSDGVFDIKVRAMDNNGNWRDSDGGSSSGNSRDNARILRAEIDTYPPKSFSISNIYDGQYFDEGKVIITWNPANDVNLDHYELCIGTDQNDVHGSAVYSATYESTVTSCEVNLSGGIYYIYMAAHDKAGHIRRLDGSTDVPESNLDLTSTWKGKWPCFEIDHDPPTVVYNPNAYPPISNPYFSPNGDGKKDTTTISYSVTDESYWRVNHLKQNEVSIEVTGEIIKDGKMARKWTNKSPPGWQQVVWDGTMDDAVPAGRQGRRTRDGIYSIKIIATDKALNTSVNDSQWVVVDTTPPEIKNIASSGIFSPNSDGEFDADNLAFSLQDNLSSDIASTIEVIDSESRVIAGPVEPRRLTAGSTLSSEWDGLTVAGWLAPDDTYRYRISAEDLAGNSAVNDSTNIVVDTTPPQIINLTDNISKLQFKENYGSLDLKFKILESSGYANVFASILDSKGSMIQNYPIMAEADKQYQVSWNGKDSFGFFVPDHSYIYYRLYAIDCVGNKKYLDSNQLIRVETPYTGVLGNIIYSPDGELKIIIPQEALTSEAELSIEMRDTPPKSYKVDENDNITLTYELLPEGLKFSKPCQILFHYDPSKLNIAGQSVLPFEYTDSNGWKQLSGNFKNDVFNGFIDESGSFVIGADLTPPEPPIVNQPKSPTTSDLITVYGAAEHDTTVSLNVNDILYAKDVHSPDWTISNVDIVEGENIIYATAKDNSGNISQQSKKIIVFKDRTPPILNVSNAEILYISPNADGNQDTAHLSASAMDSGSTTCEVWLSINGPSGKELLFEKYDNNLDLDWGDSNLAEGDCTYDIRAVDSLDNFSQKNGNIIVDKTAPYALLEPRPINYYISGNLELWGSVDDSNLSNWILDYARLPDGQGSGNNPSSYTEIARGYSSKSYGLLSNFDARLLPSGVYAFRLTGYDRAGNVKSVTKSKNIINSAVNAALFSPGIDERIRSAVDVKGSISISPSEFSYYDLLYGSGTNPSSWSIILESNTLPTSGNLGQWNTSGFPDGVYTLRLKTVNLGNESFIYDVPVVVDNTNPISQITYPASADVLGGVISMQGTSSDLNFSQYRVEYGEGVNPLSWTEIKTSQAPVTTGTLADWSTGSLNGTYTVRLTTTDKAGNTSSSQVSFTMDNYINASLDFPSSGMVLSDTIQIKGTVSDINFKEYRVEYGSGSNPMVFYPIGSVHTNQVTNEQLETWNTKTVSDGTYTIRLLVTDQAENQIIKKATIIVDNTYPTVSISNPIAGSCLAGNIGISGTVYDDNIQSYKLEYQDNSNPGNWNYIYSTSEAKNIQNDSIFNWAANALNGSYAIRVSATDKTGKTSSDQVSMIIDNIKPNINITSPTRESINTGNLDIIGEISDVNLKDYSIKYGYGIEPTRWWNLTSGSSVVLPPSSIVTWPTINVKDGYYTLRFEAEDKAGNKYSYDLPIDIDNSPAIAEIQEPADNQVVSGEVSIKGIACDADFTTYNFKRYEVLYGQGASPTQWTTIESLVVPKINDTLTSLNTLSLADGIYTIKLRSQDISGITEKTRSIIIDNTKPSLSISSPNDGSNVSGNIQIIGTASDNNFDEYKIYYKNTSSSDWTEIGSGSSVVPLPLSLVTWNTTLVGDGSYVLKLWAKDKAGNEHEITRNYIVNNTLDVNNISLQSSVFSPNGDGIDDKVKIKYNLTSNNNVTVKVYKKPGIYTYNWSAFGSGTRYPAQDFSYTLSASGKNFPSQLFNWRVDGSGVETYYTYSLLNSPQAYARSTNDKAEGESSVFSLNYDQKGVKLNFTANSSGWDDARKYWAYRKVGNEWKEVYFHETEGAGSWSLYGPKAMAEAWWVMGLPSQKDHESTFYLSQTENVDFSVRVDSNCLIADIYIYKSSNYGNSWDSTPVYSETIYPVANKDFSSTLAGGYLYKLKMQVLAIQYNHTWCEFGASNYTWPAGDYKLRTWLDVGMWDDGTVTMSMDYQQRNTLYNYPSDYDSGLAIKYYDGTISGNSYSVTLYPQNSGTISGHSISYTQTSGSGVSTSRDSSGWSGNTCSGVINATYNYAGNLWNPDSQSGGSSCTAGPGAPIVITSDTMENKFLDPLQDKDPGGSYHINPISFSLIKNNGDNVNLRFVDENGNDIGSTTSNIKAKVKASTSYSEPWNTSMDPSVGNGGWIKQGAYSLPFYYNEASDSRNVYNYYTLPSNDIVVSDWNVNSDNSYTKVYGVNANGDFNICLADNMLVKTLQYDSPTSAGEHSIEWDGTDNNGNTVPDNDYIFVIYAGGNTARKGINGESSVNVQQSSEISSLAVSEAFISPNGDGLKDSTAINYTLSQNANSVSAAIKDKDGNTIRTISGPALIGSHAITWNGKNDSNAIVPDGTYSVVVTAINANGATRVKSASVTVDNNNPPISDEDPKLIVSSSAWEESPAYSPDKTKLAFAKEISGKKQICVMDLTSSQLTQLTTQGENKQPSFSPDGLKIAFLSDRSGNIDIWKINQDGSQAKQITANPATENNPKWSPDGSKIVYSSDRLGELMLSKWNIWEINADGSNPTQVTKDQATLKDDNPSSSPDGKKIVYDSDQDGNFNIWMINTDGSGKLKITASSEAETKPIWSPDGSKIAYQNQKGIGLFDVKNNISQQLISQEGATSPSWSKDGTELLYNDNAGNIYSKSTYAGALTGVITYPILNQKLSGLVEIKGTALDTNLEGYKVEYSPNTTPYVWAEIGHSDIPKKDGILAVWNTAPLIDGQYVLKLTAWDKAGNSIENSLIINSNNDNWKLTISSLTQITSSDAWDIEPTWSPDGSKIAFSSNRSGNLSTEASAKVDYDIWVMNSDGTGLSNLTNNPAYDGKPKWSPDGTKIAFVSDRSGNLDIWTMNADGSNLKQLTDLTIIDTDPCWSPDGSKIAFSSNRSNNFNIWTINSDGSGIPQKITSGEANDIEPSWSKWGIAFTSNREIWMIDENGTQEAFRLTNNPAGNYEPCWSPFAIPLSDGSNRPLVTFTSNRQGNPDIFVMDTDGVDQSKSLTDYTNTDCNPSWSPDGSKVAYASFKDGQYDVWIMNFAIRTSILSVPSIKQVSGLEIISPKGGQNIDNLRPVFEWWGIRGQTSYRIVARKDITSTTFPKNISPAEASPESGARPAIAYSIGEFDDGLARGEWNWKVQALDQNNNIIAETPEESFEINPPFTISNITNYPNPFNPNKERTKIRYKLSKDADDVTIRIYDIMGSLVNELSGLPFGEIVNIWLKYNDIDWDGRNGRGDVVVNGIYPFEVVARLGDKSVSGRGKIAVLK